MRTLVVRLRTVPPDPVSCLLLSAVPGQHVGTPARFQRNGHDHKYDWTARGADGSHLSALLQIRKATLTGYGAGQRA